jgi:hypothetical protein
VAGRHPGSSTWPGCGFACPYAAGARPLLLIMGLGGNLD